MGLRIALGSNVRGKTPMQQNEDGSSLAEGHVQQLDVCGRYILRQRRTDNRCKRRLYGERR